MAKHNRQERRTAPASNHQPAENKVVEEAKAEVQVAAEQAGVELSTQDTNAVAEKAAEDVASGKAENVSEAVAEEVKPVLKKYEKAVAARGGNYVAVPSGFKYANKLLVVGPSKPQKDTSVMGRIYNMVARHKTGITGADLIGEMVARRDWQETGAKILYAATGVVCSDWCAGYINGALRAKNGFLVVHEGTKAQAKEVTKENIAEAEEKAA